jgi:gamma-glutamylputrescine oxidase
VIEALHKRSLLSGAAELVEALHGRYGYDRARLLGTAETTAALGSERFFGAVADADGGHLDPYRFAIGLARAAAGLGAAIHENTPAIKLDREKGPLVRTARGDIRADQVIIATDGRSGPLENATRRRMIGINSFLIVTEPLGPEGDPILPGEQSAADSRFVVRYWRKLADGRLLFGGGESNAGRIPADVRSFVRPHLLEIYPQLENTPIVHGWGGVVSATVPRLPFVREIAPAVWAAGGFSGQGVALAPFIGKLLADELRGRANRLFAFTDLSIPPLPLATSLRRSIVNIALWRGRLADRL